LAGKDFLAAFPVDRHLNPKDPTVDELFQREMKANKDASKKQPPGPGEEGYEEYLRTGEY